MARRHVVPRLRYGWESQLLETGFLCVFLCGLWNPRHRPTNAVLYLLRWLAFRISIGAGLIKIRGGSCWATKTCLWYHFETQPVPSPLSFAFHFLPRAWLSRGVDVDLAVQLYASVFVLTPGFGAVLRAVRRGAGIAQAAFMVFVAASGNFSFLNHLTLLPALACLDDGCFPARWRTAAPRPRRPRLRRAIDAALVLAIAWLSRPVVANLVAGGGRGQRMNASYDPWRLVNTYGAFGSVGEARYEAIVSVSIDGGWSWREVEFPCKPGAVTRRPCFSAPYHHRLDWNIWFLGFKPHAAMLRKRESWLYAFLEKLLDDDAGARSLLDPASAADPALFPDPKVGKVVKVDMYRYRMAAPLWAILRAPAADRVWWTRSFEEALVPPMKLTRDGKLAYSARPGLY